MIWGAGFAAQHAAMQGMGPLAFTAVRFFLGWLVLQPLLRRREAAATAPASFLPSFRAPWQLGVVLFAGALFQQYGLLWTTAAKAGFLTGLYVVFVPLLGLLLKHRLGWNTWLGTLLAAVGLYFLSITDGFRLAQGDGLVLIGAVVWAIHVLMLGHLAARQDALRLAADQFLVVALLATAAALVFEPQDPAEWLTVWPWVLYSGVFAVAIAFTLQAVAQAKASPAHCAILLSFEAVFAAIAGVLLLGERLSLREVGGGCLMFCGILVSQVARPKSAQVDAEVHPPAS
jgi:drug/metabolite transporter (DMT)-like permease